MKKTNDSWRVDETYIKVRGRWMYLHRAVDSAGQTLDFLLNETRSTRAAKRFFRKVLGRHQMTPPRVINVDKDRAYVGAVRDLIRDKLFPETCKRRPSRYMNNIVGSPLHQKKGQARPRVRFLPDSLENHPRLRSDAYDQERTNEWHREGRSKSPKRVHRRPLQTGSMSAITSRFARFGLDEFPRNYLQQRPLWL